MRVITIRTDRRFDRDGEQSYRHDKAAFNGPTILPKNVRKIQPDCGVGKKSNGFYQPIEFGAGSFDRSFG
jgi:hypothetical protein